MLVVHLQLSVTLLVGLFRVEVVLQRRSGSLGYLFVSTTWDRVFISGASRGIDSYMLGIFVCISVCPADVQH